MAGRKAATKTELVLAASQVLEPSGYRAPAEQPAAALAKARDLIGLPRVQEHMRTVFADAGLSEETIAARLAEIVQAPDAEVSLRAIELYLKATVGFAVAKQAVAHTANGGADAFFTKQRFTAPGRPKLVTDPKEL